MAKLSDIFLAMINAKTLSNNKWLVIMIFLAVTGGTGTVHQFLGIKQIKKEKNKAIHEVATAFQNTIMELEQPKKVKKAKAVVYKTDCTQCKKLIEEAIFNHEKGRLH